VNLSFFFGWCFDWCVFVGNVGRGAENEFGAGFI